MSKNRITLTDDFVLRDKQVGIGTTNPVSTLHVNGNVRISAAVTATSFSGSGAGLTSLSAANISSGTLAIARGGTNSTAIPTNGGVAYGTGSAFAFNAAGTSGQILQSEGAAAPTWSSNLNLSGVATVGTVRVSSGIVTATTGIVTYYGDGQYLTGISGGSGEFNTGITSTVQIYPLSWETSSFTFPSTAGKRYVIESINVSNVAAGNTEVNIITRIGQTEKSYIAYNVPIVSGGLVELLKQPIVAEPSDEIRSWSTDYTYVGVSTATEMYISYSEHDNTDYFRVIASDPIILTGDLTTIYTSTTNPSVLQSIHLVNKSDSGDYPVSITITNGVTTSYLAKDLIIPRYSVANILDRPKRIEVNGTLKVQVGQVGTIDVIVAGKKITG